MIRGKVKQLREINFEILGEKYRHIDFKDIFSFSKSEFKKVRSLPALKGGGKRILIHTGGSSLWPIKLWENEKWAELIKKINSFGNFRFIFVGIGDEEKVFKDIQKRLDFKVYSLINGLDIKDLTIAMRLSDFFIGIDSGPRNMAHLADLPSLCLPLIGPKFLMPPNKRDVVIKVNCKCPGFFCYRKKTCLERVSAQEAFIKFKELLRRTKISK
jgi:ADP-heptose:LPS heptosyltransferase